MLIGCENCGCYFTVEGNDKIEKVNDEEIILLICHNCKEKFLFYIVNDKIKEWQEEVKKELAKNIVNLYIVDEYRSKIKEEQIRLREKYER